MLIFDIIKHEGVYKMKYESGKIIKGCVTGIESYGIFVSFDEYYSGLIHISEVSNNFVRNIGDYVNIGGTIKAKILEVDDDSCQLKLSIKDINYRTNKRNRTKIEETGTGFELLKENLDHWVNEKTGNNTKKNQKF